VRTQDKVEIFIKNFTQNQSMKKEDEFAYSMNSWV